jgi:CheY-like chemotaxis protein
LNELPCVLIIDDDPDGCEVVAAYLAKAGHDVRCVANGRAALAALGERVPDAILLDVRMPTMDGLELLGVIRSYLRWSVVPIALLTAYPEDPRLWSVAEHGVTKVFTKSAVRLDELLEWVNVAADGGAARPGARPGSDDPCRHADTE